MLEGIREDTFFMYKTIHKLDYSVIAANYRQVLQYASTTADSFSVITDHLKPYNVIPPRCKHDEILESIKGNLVNQAVGVTSWPGTKTSARHKVLNLYQITKKTKEWLIGCPNLFLLSESLPQDICFYRKGEVWLYSTTHEKEIDIINPTDADTSFFVQLCQSKSTGGGGVCSPRYPSD